MADYDRLPPELRAWLAHALLPWRARSVMRAYESALKRTGNKTDALKALNELEIRRVAKDARKVWGAEHPAARA